MSAHGQSRPANPVEDAIRRVLDAEQAVRTEVAQFAAEAERLRQSGRSRARSIAERGARRAAGVHRWTDTAISARLRDLDHQRSALGARTTDSGEPGRVLEAVKRLAAELTSAGA
jgi:hypothetical protein